MGYEALRGRARRLELYGGVELEEETQVELLSDGFIMCLVASGSSEMGPLLFFFAIPLWQSSSKSSGFSVLSEIYACIGVIYIIRGSCRVTSGSR